MKKINDLNPDIVHLQWVQGGMLNVKDLSKLSAPLVWGLNDMWAFTGGCHYDEDCGGSKCLGFQESFLKKPGSCPTYPCPRL